MSKTLVVLESPNKVENVQNYLGNTFLVTSSRGHFRDLDPKSLSLEIENKYKPIYYVNKDKEYVVQQLKRSYSKCTDILLATDKDREGESIAWHVAEVLNIPHANRRRMLFTEITKKAIKAATDNTKPLDMNMFYAQQARRIIDRLIGYKWLSPLLWKNIQSSMKKNMSLSGGRVQSVVNKLIIDREKEIEKFSADNYFKTRGEFSAHNGLTPEQKQSNNTYMDINMDLDYKFTKAQQVETFIDLVAESGFKVDSVSDKKTTRKPSAPFITSTLQQEASNKFRMSPKQTMSYAQNLYAEGLITYMRTDSVTLSVDILEIIKKKIIADYGKKYINIQQYKNKSKNSQEAHEAIRPSNMDVFSIKRNDSKRLCDNCVKLYNLIWRRTMASQMSPAEVNIQTVKVAISPEDTSLQKEADKYKFVTKTDTILFDGFLRVYNPVTIKENDYSEDDDTTNTTNTTKISLQNGQVLLLKKLNSVEKFTRPSVGRFTEASLVKKLDDMGIGRPSTYSSMVSIVQDRNYVEKRDIDGEVKKIKIFNFDMETCELDNSTEETKINGEKGKLVPTDIGRIVNTYLENNIGDVLDYEFTVKLEKQLDDIAQGRQDWVSVVQYIYDIFEPKFIELNNSSSLEKDKYTRVLGNDPYTGRQIVAYIAKYGPVVCLKSGVDAEDKDKGGGKRNTSATKTSTTKTSATKTSATKDKFVSLKETDVSIETVTLNEAIEMLKYPYELCEYKDHPVMICNGKYGLYLKYNNKNWSLKDKDEPQTLEDIEEYFNEVEEKEKEVSKDPNSVGLPRKINDKLKIMSGKFGPYIMYKKSSSKDSKPMFVNLGKANPLKITEKECMELISNKSNYKKSNYKKSNYKK